MKFLSNLPHTFAIISEHITKSFDLRLCSLVKFVFLFKGTKMDTAGYNYRSIAHSDLLL